MAQELNAFDLVYLIIMFMGSFFGCSLVCALAGYYSSTEIKEIFNEVISENLKKSPIFDIKINEDCSNSDKNILGFFGGTKEGYIYDGIEILDKCKYKKCEKLNEIPRTEYKILKNNKICGKMTEKNYFDYYKLTINKNNKCTKNEKRCGYLDYYKNILCLPENMECPINDIVISNHSNFTHNNYIYKKIKLSDNQYLYYTSDNINGYIITSLSSLIFGIPCGSKNYQNYSISPLDNYSTCNDYYYRDNYYYYVKNLTTLNAKEFLSQNHIYDNITNIPSYYNKKINETNLTIFAIGYIGISDDFIANFNPDTNFMIEISKKLKFRGAVSKICFISIIVLGGYTFFVVLGAVASNNRKAKIIIIFIEIILLLLINITAFIEINYPIYLPYGQFPDDYLTGRYSYRDNLEGNGKGHAHFWPFFPLLLFSIIYYIYIFLHNEKEKNKDSTSIDNTLLETVDENYTDNYPVNTNYGNYNNQNFDNRNNQLYSNNDYPIYNYQNNNNNQNNTPIFYGNNSSTRYN